MKLRPFELALVIIFLVLAIASLVLLSNYKSKPTTKDGELQAIGVVNIWGTLPPDGIRMLLSDLAEDNDAYRGVNYKYYHPDEFDSELLRAMADGLGPDLVLMSHEKLVDMRRRIEPISYEAYPRRDIQNAYIEGAQIFALSDGMYGLPIAVDPMMMYWNRDIYATEGFLAPARTWESFVNSIFPKLIKRDFDRTIIRAAVAMGEYGNVRNSFGIVSTLLLQQGSQGVVETSDGTYLIKLQQSFGGEGDPLRSAADFYTRFSQPGNNWYSWNRAFIEDRTEFLAEDLATYFGYASEGRVMEKMNPNLNFDIAEVPQDANATIRRTYGKFYTLAVMRSSNNKAGANAVMVNLGGAEIADQIAERSNMVPVYGSSVSLGSNDIFGRAAFLSAPITFGWLNPNMESADGIFETMTEDINENRRDLGGAVGDVSGRLKNEY
tara:strand:- start:1200 stop:2510 length:1311 start_codon:yes stop_codon:yes gene_type:complete